MRTALTLTLLLLAFLTSAPSFAADNPFLTGRGSATQGEAQPQAAPDPPPVFSRWVQTGLHQITVMQRQLRERMSRAARDMREHPYGSSFWVFMGLATLYGAVHALGPGHGKSIVCSYFLGRSGSLLHGVFLGNLLAAVHVLSAVVLVMTFSVLLGKGMGGFENAQGLLARLSYVLLTVIGGFLAVKTWLDYRKRVWERHTAEEDKPGYRGLSVLALATGLVPCPGAALVLMFSVSLGIVLPGLIAMIFIIIGMGLTQTFFALVSICSRSAIWRIASTHSRLVGIVYLALSGGAACFIMAFGGLLLLS